MVVDARHHGAQAQVDVFHRFEFCDGCSHPILCRSPVNADAIDRRAPAPMVGLFAQEHLGPRATGLEGRLQARNPAAGDDDVHMGVEMLVPVGVRVLGIGRFAKARRLPDEWLEHVFPERARVDEGLVVESGRQEARECCVHLPDVPFEAGPVVLRRGGQAVEELGGRGALVGFMPVTLPEVHERVGFFPARRNDAARAVILERPAHDPLAVGHERGGKRITGMARKTLAVEGEFDLRAAVDQAAAPGQTGAHGVASQSGRLALIAAMMSAGGSVVCARYVPNTSSVAVSRAARNHLPQPLAWRQRSKCTPRTLGRRKR
jgi:hypothetical protein